MFTLRYSVCNQTRRIPESRAAESCYIQPCRHKQGIFSEAPGNSPDVDMIPSLSESTEQQKGVCVGTWDLHGLVLSYCLQVCLLQ